MPQVYSATVATYKRSQKEKEKPGEYVSIPHRVIFKALREAHVPDEIVNPIQDYYKVVQIRFTTCHYETKWQKVEKGIITGCTLSLVLFSLAMTYVVLSVKETKVQKYYQARAK